MKAAVCTKYGAPDVLELRDVIKPAPKDDEVLIRVYASSVTIADSRVRSFTFAPWFNPIARVFIGFRGPRKVITGDEFAGIVESVGPGVKNFKVGDEVFGMTSHLGFGGTNAEFMCFPENKMLAMKPENMNYTEAAVIPFGGITALHFLRMANIEPGQHVLIYGASGSVGTFAVQIAIHFGAHVTAVCSTKHVDLVGSLGADSVIDYTQQDFTTGGETYDVVFDAVLKTSFSECRAILNPSGIYLTVDWPIFDFIKNRFISRKRIIFGIAPGHSKDLVYLKDLVEQGKLRSVIDRSYLLGEIVAAHTFVDKGHKQGNVAIIITPETQATSPD